MIVKIADIADVKGGKRLPKGEDLTSVPTDNPYIRAQDIRDGKITIDDPKFLTPEQHQRLKRYIVAAGDVCIVIVGANVGDVGIVPKQLHGANLTENAVKLTNFRNDCIPQYVDYCLSAPDAQAQMQQIAGGAAQPKLGIYKVLDVEIPFHPKDTQERIASILSAYDDLIENNTRRIKILEDMANMLYREWFVNFRFPGHHKVKMVESELGPIPEGWQVETLENVVDEFIDYRGKTPKKLDGDWAESGILALSALNVKQGRLVNLEKSKFVSEELYQRWMKSELRAGDVLMTSEAPLGEVYFMPETRRYCLSQRVFAIRSNCKMMKSTLLFFFLSSPEGQEQLKARASGTTVLGIRQADLRRIPLIEAPMATQEHGDSVLRPILNLIGGCKTICVNVLRIK